MENLSRTKYTVRYSKPIQKHAYHHNLGAQCRSPLASSKEMVFPKAFNQELSHWCFHLPEKRRKDLDATITRVVFCMIPRVGPFVSCLLPCWGRTSLLGPGLLWRIDLEDWICCPHTGVLGEACDAKSRLRRCRLTTSSSRLLQLKAPT